MLLVFETKKKATNKHFVAKGKASTESAGIIGAIAEQAAKLEPQKSAPVITLENDNNMCIIQRNGTITGAVFKNIS